MGGNLAVDEVSDTKQEKMKQLVIKELKIGRRQRKDLIECVKENSNLSEKEARSSVKKAFNELIGCSLIEKEKRGAYEISKKGKDHQTTN